MTFDSSQITTIIVTIAGALLFSTSSMRSQFRVAPDKQNHLTAGFMIGGASNVLTYKFTERKVLAFGVVLGMSVLAGHLKEQYDLNKGSGYDNKDLQATGLGGIIGSGTVTIILIPSVPKRKLPLEYHYLLDDENTMIRK